MRVAGRRAGSYLLKVEQQGYDFAAFALEYSLRDLHDHFGSQLGWLGIMDFCGWPHEFVQWQPYQL